MRVLLIRHAQSSNNPLEGSPDFARHHLPDPPLTSLGHGQAARFADWAATDSVCRGITHLYSSLMTRAVQTAAPLARTLGLPVYGFADACECGGLSTGPAGGFAPVVGRDHASLLSDCPALVWPAELSGQPWNGGCEPWDVVQFARRAERVVARLLDGADDAAVVALVTHHDFAQFLLAELLKLSPTDSHGPIFRLDNTGSALVELAADGQPRTLHWLNRRPHLHMP